MKSELMIKAIPTKDGVGVKARCRANSERETAYLLFSAMISLGDTAAKMLGAERPETLKLMIANLKGGWERALSGAQKGDEGSDE